MLKLFLTLTALLLVVPVTLGQEMTAEIVLEGELFQDGSLWSPTIILRNPGKEPGTISLCRYYGLTPGGSISSGALWLGPINLSAGEEKTLHLSPGIPVTESGSVAVICESNQETLIAATALPVAEIKILDIDYWQDGWDAKTSVTAWTSASALRWPEDPFDKEDHRLWIGFAADSGEISLIGCNVPAEALVGQAGGLWILAGNRNTPASQVECSTRLSRPFGQTILVTIISSPWYNGKEIWRMEEIGASRPLFDDGFESGDVSQWSWSSIIP